MLARICTIIAIGLASTQAYAAVPVKRDKTPLRSEAKPERCIQATTIQRFTITPSGKMKYLGGVTMWTACK